LYQANLLITFSVDEVHVRSKISELIAMLEEPFNKKKLERALATPWGKSPPLPLNDYVSIIVIHAFENAEYGEEFDPIETEMIVSALREKAPIMTDQPDLVDRIIEASIPVQIFDMDDFEFAVEADRNPV
jgi:hypothetical protein